MKLDKKLNQLIGKIKFGSSGEKVTRDTNNANPDKNITIPRISANLLIAKFSNKLAVFLIFI